jgi:hypothetical protein
MLGFVFRVTLLDTGLTIDANGLLPPIALVVVVIGGVGAIVVVFDAGTVAVAAGCGVGFTGALTTIELVVEILEAAVVWLTVVSGCFNSLAATTTPPVGTVSILAALADMLLVLLSTGSCCCCCVGGFC